MVKEKKFISPGLVTMRHKYLDEHLSGNMTAAGKHDTDKSLSVHERQAQTYLQTKNDLNLRLHEQLSTLKAEISASEQSIRDCKGAHEKFEQMIKDFADLPESTGLEINSEALARLEQLRVGFFSIKASYARMINKNKNSNNAPGVNAPQISLLPELNSLHQLQMLKMGLCFAFPLIIGIIVGCGIIAWVIIITWGG